MSNENVKYHDKIILLDQEKRLKSMCLCKCVCVCIFCAAMIHTYINVAQTNIKQIYAYHLEKFIGVVECHGMRKKPNMENVKNTE